MVVKFIQDHTHLSNNWNVGDVKNIDNALAQSLIDQSIAIADTSDCGCGQ